MPSITPHSLFERFVALIYILTEPNSELTDPEKRLSARLLSGIMLVLVAFLVMIIFAEVFVLESGDWLVILEAAMSVALLTGLYVISRSKLYLLSARILIAQAIITPAILVIQEDGIFSSVGLSYLTISVLISSLVFSIGFTASLALLVSIITILTTLHFQPIPTTDISAIYLNVILVGLITIVAMIRNQHQKIISQQAALLINERNLLRTVIETIPAFIYVKDRESRFVLVNQKVAKGLNLSEEAVVGKSDADFVDEIYANEYRQTEMELMETGQSIIEDESYRTLPNGEKVWMIVTKVPLHDESGQIIGLVGINRSIDERKEAEKALLEERNLLRTIIENIPDQIYIKDRQSRVTMANSPVLKRHSLNFTYEILGKTNEDLFPDDPQQAERHANQERRIFETGETVNNLENSYIKNGKQYWNLITKVPMRNSAGEIIGLIGINRDITDRKVIEDKLMEEHNLLRSIIENIPDQVYVKDRDSRFLLVNGPLLERHNLNSVDDVLGKTDFDLFPENA